jgi:hypothetical protein
MNRETYKEVKVTFDEITRLLDEENLTEEEKQSLEKSKAQLAGQLHSIWWPFDWGRRSIMIVLLLVGIYGLGEGNNLLLLAWVVIPFFSPRSMGELFYAIGKVYGIAFRVR